MDAKDGFMFLVLLLLSLGLFGSLSLTYCVWNKQTELASELQNELHELQKRSEIADIQNEVHMLQIEVQDLKLTNGKLQSELADVHNRNSRVHLRTSEPSQDKGQLKRNVRHASNDNDTLSATEILTNALTEIIEMKEILLLYMDCNKNEYNHTKCTFKPGLKGEPGNNGTPGMQGIAGQRGPPGLLGPPGPTGSQGSPGIQGMAGQRGPVGLKGDTGLMGQEGPKGPTGDKGTKGEPGDMGPKGDPGDKGMKGNVGVKGEQGRVGETGLPGPHGDRGDKGDVGERGLKGDMGPQGPKGETGGRGDTGQKGELGEKGMKGNQGDKGEKGEQGAAGPESSPTTTSTTAPTTAIPGQCGGPGWRRVVFLNMTDPSQVCPAGLANTTYSRRTCGQAHSGFYNCSSTTFSVGGSQYSRVCGRALAYRFGRNFAFLGYHGYRRQGIDDQYVDGLSLTHGVPGSRQHIWTFASGFLTRRHRSTNPSHWCPCDNNNAYPSPPFVGNDYFCESVRENSWADVFYPDAQLWDGQVCEGGGTCCKFNNPPWFTKNLTNPTTENIELRLCLWFNPPYGNIALEQLELYVQ